MGSPWVTFITMTILFTAGNSQPTSNYIDIPEKCKNSELCDKRPEIYDMYQEKMDESMKRIYENWQHAVDDTVFDLMTLSESPSDNCKSESVIMKPYVHISNTTSLVVQTKFFEQKFRTTYCKKSQPKFPKERYVEGARCFDALSLESMGYNGRCRTKQSTIKLYVYNTYRKEIERVPVNIDVCCACDITSVDYSYD